MKEWMSAGKSRNLFPLHPVVTVMDAGRIAAVLVRHAIPFAVIVDGVGLLAYENDVAYALPPAAGCASLVLDHASLHRCLLVFPTPPWRRLCCRFAS